MFDFLALEWRLIHTYDPDSMVRCADLDDGAVLSFEFNVAKMDLGLDSCVSLGIRYKGWNFDTQCTADWPEFDRRFGRENWQTYLERSREHYLAYYADDE